MAVPRCGVRDRFEDEPQNDYYVLLGAKWLKTNLTYKVKKYPSNSNSKLTRTDVDNTIIAAFRIWEAATNIKFEKRQAGNVDIDISFEKGDHRCGSPFDGPSDGKKDNQLGHAFPPGQFSVSGDIHIDDTEQWTTKTSGGGINLLSVFLHELGHSLGLDHSAETDSVMSPRIRRNNPYLKLHDDDIKAIRSLYGSKKMESCASGLSFSWFSVTCKIKRDDCAPRQAHNLKFKFLKGCGCQCCDLNGCGPKNYGK